MGVAVTWYPKPFDLVARKPLETTRTAGRQIYYIWTETGMLFLQSFLQRWAKITSHGSIFKVQCKEVEKCLRH